MYRHSQKKQQQQKRTRRVGIMKKQFRKTEIEKRKTLKIQQNHMKQ